MANIHVVARVASVSVATVLAVVNQSAYVSPPLQARVKSAILNLGYQPNLLARGLAKRQSHLLGMIVPDIVNPAETVVDPTLACARATTPAWRC